MKTFLLSLLAFVCFQTAQATPEFVEHIVGNSVFGEATGTTERNPQTPREDEAVTLWVRIGYSFFYTDVAVYYTTDGSTPSGSKGVGSGTTQVLRSSAGQVTFVRNENTGSGVADWWSAPLPASARTYGQTIKYRIGAWHNSGGPEIWANNYGCSDGTCNDPSNTPVTFTYTNKIAWPGKGSNFVDHSTGYPPTWIWKEEAVTGNNHINTMLDQNGSFYDIYYPSTGCVNGMGTKNEGYVDGIDTFPPGLPLGNRGQMNLNEAFLGFRVGGKSYWQTNQNGTDFTSVTQKYTQDTQTIESSCNFVGGGNNVAIQQYDFSPKNVAAPSIGQFPEGIHIKRLLLTNNNASTTTMNVYFYADFALNGGDVYDVMSTDDTRGAMMATDNTFRLTSTSGEYNPTSFGNYTKNVSITLAASMKVCSTVGGAAGTPATGSWRDTSSDDNQGWIGEKVTIPAGATKEIDIAIVGGFDSFAGANSTYSVQVAPVLDWFLGVNSSTIQAQTNSYWTNWLASGTTITSPSPTYNTLFKRSLLATALHLDAKGGGVVAGMHNGAYPFVWPRDAVYAAVTLSRTGHQSESKEVYRFLKDVAFRSNDTFGKGFWYQKYSTDGYQIWTSPQVDETAVVPWGVLFQYNASGDATWLSQQYTIVKEAALASSQDSTIDTRLFYDDANKLMHSNNVWEDSFDDFLYSNANVIRGLDDAAKIATTLGNSGDAATFSGRSANVMQGVRGRLSWNGENCDISQLGLVYPFEVLSPTDPDAVKSIDRINGTASDNNNQLKPLVNNSGEFSGLINRYFGDTYWNGGPWFLSTIWYGMYYAMRQDLNPGKADIDLHKSKIDLLIGRLGPNGLGAEQISPSNSLLYGGQANFSVQAAWPNAWESMSSLVDSIMMFLDFTPDAPHGAFKIEPKLPTAWPTLTYSGLMVGGNSMDVTLSDNSGVPQADFTNKTGGALSATVVLRMGTGKKPGRVTVNGLVKPFVFDAATGRVTVTTPLRTGIDSHTIIKVLVPTSTTGNPIG